MRVANQEQCDSKKRRPRRWQRGHAWYAQRRTTNIRGDMPVAQPFDGRLQRSSQLAAVLLGHQHGQGIAPRSFQATTENGTTLPPLGAFHRQLGLGCHGGPPLRQNSSRALLLRFPRVLARPVPPRVSLPCYTALGPSTSRFRKAASPASDTSTHFRSGEASAS